MHPDTYRMMLFLLSLGLVASSEAFFLKWGSESVQPTQPKTWMQPMAQHISPAIRYQYTYSPYDSRKMYQMQAPQYQPEVQMQQSMAPIPISIPAGASLTPVSLQHVQLVPCMCPVAPEEAEKLQEQNGPGPFVAQSYTPASYQVAQQVPVTQDVSKTTNKQ